MCIPAGSTVDAVALWLRVVHLLPLLTSHLLRTRCSSEFVFINPNAKGTCGCGESFTTDPKAASEGTNVTAPNGEQAAAAAAGNS